MNRLIKTILAFSGIALALAGQEGGPRPALEPQITEDVVHAPPDELWKVLSTAEGWRKLGVAKCEMDFRVGGLIRTHYSPQGRIGDEGTIENEILSYEPGRMLAIRVRKPPKSFPFSEETWRGTWTVMTLSEAGEGRTRLRIAGMGYPDTEPGRKMLAFFRTGNAWVLDHLGKQYPAAAASRSAPGATLEPIALERVVDLPREEVWALFTTAEGWKRFFDTEARIELRPGGKFEILFGADQPEGQRGSEGCKVLSLLPGEMISYSWNAPPKLAHARTRHTWVVVRFDDAGPGRTRVRLGHHGFAEQAADNPDHRTEWVAARAYFEQAWPSVLNALKGRGK
jgi:uncharacterized protein YndB with AHSA1/START domain